MMFRSNGKLTAVAALPLPDRIYSSYGATIMQLEIRGRNLRVRVSLIFGVLVSAAIGCGQSSTTVGPKQDASISGKVTYKGKPVTDAIISFESTDRGAYGTPFKDGTYSVSKLASGEFTITVNPVAAPPKMEPTADGKIPEAAKRDDVPQKYRSAATSGTKTTVKAGANKFDLDMVD